MGVDQIAIVRNGKRTLDMPHYQRLRIDTIIAAGRGIPDMSDGNIALSQSVQLVTAEYLLYQTNILMMSKNTSVIHNNAAALLSSVLQCEQCRIGHRCRVGIFRRKYPEHTAFLMDPCKHLGSFLSVPAVGTKSTFGLADGSDRTGQ